MNHPQKIPLLLALASVGVALALTGCPSLPSSPSGPMIQDGQATIGSIGNVKNLSQGWTEDHQQKFYFTDQGSRMFPYSWFLVLEEPGSTKTFRANDNMERYRWIPASPTDLNPDGLPVGFTKDVDDRTSTSYVGFNCAACHTGQINFGKVSLRIDGGPTMADSQLFTDDMTKAIHETLNSKDKFARFAAAVFQTEKRTFANDAARDEAVQELTRQLGNWDGYYAGRLARNTSPSPYGHSRLDAFGNILNEVLAYDLNQPGNVRPADAPVSIPFIWDASWADRVQWNGVAPNNPVGAPEGSGSLGRNVGEVLGVFGYVEVTSGLGYVDTKGLRLGAFKSSVKTAELGAMETWVKELWSPKWPESVLPALDPAKAKRGAVVYNTEDDRKHSCASCHEVIDRASEKRWFKAHLVPITDTKTDPTMAMNFVNRYALTGPLEGTPISFTLKNGITRWETSDWGGDVLSGVVKKTILGDPLAAVFAALQSNARAYPAPLHTADELKVYKARPLNGIWATAPYPHNGSVPNLWEMLQSPSKRVKTFYVGSRDFDPVNVGFSTAKFDDVTPPFDTALYANSNSGHYWGTQFTDAQKWDLIEYLKSL